MKQLVKLFETKPNVQFQVATGERYFSDDEATVHKLRSHKLQNPVIDHKETIKFRAKDYRIIHDGALQFLTLAPDVLDLVANVPSAWTIELRYYCRGGRNFIMDARTV